VVFGMCRVCLQRSGILPAASLALPHITLISPNPSEPSPQKKALFPLGRLLATRGAISKIAPDEIQVALDRHHSGDWGDVDEHDRQENESSLRDGLRLLSVYHTRAGTKFYIITEHDRSVTTVLLPEEY
jgi:hypothetical protein